MKRLGLIIALFFSLAASAGPSIVESGGYTFLPGLKVTRQGILVPIGTGFDQNVTTLTNIAGTIIGSYSGFASVWVTSNGLTPSNLNYTLSDTGGGLQLNTRSGTTITLRNNNTTVATLDTTTLTFNAATSGTNAVAFGTNGQRLDLGSGSGDYLDSDGTNVRGGAGIVLPSGGLHALNVPPLVNGGIAVGTVSSFAAVCPGSNSGYSLNNCMLYSQALDTFLNAPSGSILQFRINNATIGTWGTSGLVIGSSGTAISKSNRGTGTLDFASAAAGACSADLTITVTGAAVGADVALNTPNGSVPAGSLFHAWVSATDTVTVRHCCINGTCDPASGTFSARTFNP